MLESLTIRHVALIDEVTISFHRGLQVLTGETGAGKSIVVDAVNLILGGRADRDLIRSGCDRASVEAVFLTAGNDRVQAFLNREEIDYDGQTVTVYREISAGGRNLCRVCGVMLPVQKLKELSAMLMDLHGQSEHQFLTDPEKQLQFLDQTGDGAHQELLRRTAEDCEQFLTNHRAYAKLVRQGENREERLKSLEKDLAVLKKAGLRPGESEQLQEEKKRLQSAARELSGLQSASDCLAAGDGAYSSLTGIKEASDLLRQHRTLNPEVADLSEKLDALYYELEDVSYRLSSLIDKTDADPVRLEKVENRLDLIRRLERKYGSGYEDICRARDKMSDEFEMLSGLDERIGEMSAEHKRLLAQYRNTARELTDSRRKLAAQFEKRMMNELKDLGMERTEFRVAFLPNESSRPVMPTFLGDDRIEFMICPNPGEPLKTLAKIASGGELSRLMLAVKTLEASHTGVESMVFDEIDTGISGRMAQVVAEKMMMISRERQVICVTHLPQIASAADYQYRVSKSVSGDRTVTSVLELDGDGRVEEIGRLISGADGITQESARYATAMIQAANIMKNSTGLP